MCATHGEEVHFACAGCTYTDESKTHRRMVCALAARPPALRSKIHARIRTKSTSHSVRSLHCTTSSAKVVGPTRIPSGRTPQTRHFRSERVRCNLPDSASSPTHGTCQSSPCALWPKLASAAVRAPRNEAIETNSPRLAVERKNCDVATYCRQGHAANECTDLYIVSCMAPDWPIHTPERSSREAVGGEAAHGEGGRREVLLCEEIDRPLH